MLSPEQYGILMFGLLALLTCGVLFAPLAIIYGLRNRTNDTGKAGLILGILSSIIWGLFIIYLFIASIILL